MNKKKHITFLLLHLGFGGIENTTINSCNALINDYDISIISFYKLKNENKNNLDKRVNIKYLYIGEPNRKELLESFKKIKIKSFLKDLNKAIDIMIKKKKLLKEEIKKINKGIIISTRKEFSVLLSKYGSEKVIKIAQEHCHHNNDKKYIATIKKRYNNLEYIFALTKTLKFDYIKFLKEGKNYYTKVELIPNMVIKTINKVSNLTQKIVLTVGRLHKDKQIIKLIEIFNKSNNDWQLVIVGDGPEKNKIANQIKNYNAEDRIKLLGYKKNQDLIKIYLKSSIFAMTSLTEALPMVLLEAMSFGIPCIAFKTTSGIQDIIKNNYNGYVIEQDDDEYLSKLLKLQNNPLLRKNMQFGCLETYEKFSKEKITEKWRKIV